MACDVATWRDELDGLIVQYGLMCAFGSSGDMMKAKADIGRHVDSLCSDRGALRDLTDEEIRSIDDSTHFHESPDWSVRFARNVLAAARGVKTCGEAQ